MGAIVSFPRRGALRGLARLFSICLYGCYACIQMTGLDRDRSLTQFYHTVWTARDGAPSQITALAQTTDGYLWIGSERGLFQFDGVQFRLYEPPPGVRLPSYSINSLMATPDDGLWISFNPSGVGFLKDRRLILYEQSGPEVHAFARDLDGRIWAGTRTQLLLLDGGEWLDIGESWNFRTRRVWAMFVDRSGTLWVATDDALVFLRRGSKVFQKTGSLKAGVPRIAQASDGRLWISQWNLPLRALSDVGKDPTRGPAIEVNATQFLFDRDGGLWMVGHLHGLCRLRFPERLGERTVKAEDPALEWFTEDEGLPDNEANNLLEDREGNIWVSSSKGLNRFRRSQLVPVKLPPNRRESTLMAGQQGDVWVGSALTSPVLHILPGRTVASSTRARISSVYRQSKSTIWWGGQEEYGDKKTTASTSSDNLRGYLTTGFGR